MLKIDYPHVLAPIKVDTIVPYRHVHTDLHKCVCGPSSELHFLCSSQRSLNRVSVAMVSRLMINLRDPTLLKPADSDGSDSASHAGPISTVVLEETFPTIGTAPETSSQPHTASAWCVVLNMNQSHPCCIDTLWHNRTSGHNDIWLNGLERRRSNSRESMLGTEHIL